MLAPLEDRSVIEKAGTEAADDVEDAGHAEGSDRELRDLRRALRAARLRLRRSALRSTRQIVALNAEVSRLLTVCGRQEERLERFASGAVVIDLGRKLVELGEANARLIDDSRRATVLERMLALAETERRQLTTERDALARELDRCRHALGFRGSAEGDDGACAGIAVRNCR